MVYLVAPHGSLALHSPTRTPVSGKAMRGNGDRRLFHDFDPRIF